MEFDDSNAPSGSVDIEVWILDATAIPAADHYELQYIDDNDGDSDGKGYFGTDSYWTSLPLQLETIESDQTYQFTDSNYQVEHHRYYRFAAIDQNGDVIYKNDSMQNGRVASVLKHQEWKVFERSISNFHPNNEQTTTSTTTTSTTTTSTVFRPTSSEQNSSNFYDHSIEDENWSPKFTTDADVLSLMYWTSEFHSFDAFTSSFLRVGSHSEVDQNIEQKFSVSGDPDNAQYGTNYFGDYVYNFRIDRYPYSAFLSDFRGRLSESEGAYLNPLNENSEVRLSMDISVLIGLESPWPNFFELVDFTTGKIEITWSNSNLNIEGYDPKEQRVHHLISPYIIQPTVYGNSDDPDTPESISRLATDWKITPQTWPSDEETEISIKVTFPDGSTAIEKSYTIKFPDRATAKADSTPDYYNIPFNTATGPRYRKIGINGRPLSDEKPQAASENDEAKEETYVDAFNLNLVHGVTDIYVPIPGSELTLSLRRNITSEIWSENSGLRPYERPDKPFGPAWSSNVCSNIEVITPEGPDVNQYEEPTKAYVTDENGQTHEFVQYETAWFPMPSASHEARSYLTRLTESENGFSFRQKHGNTLSFDKIPGEQRLMRDRVEGSQNYTVYTYARLDTVTDRLSYQLKYTYSGTQSLIPITIAAIDPTGNPIPNLEINVSQSGGRVDKVWDPNENEIRYNYGAPHLYTYDGYNVTSVENYLEKLISVEFMEEGAVISRTDYDYEEETEGAYTPLNGNDVASSGRPKSPPYQDPAILPCDGEQQHVNYHHLNLSAVVDANGNAYNFTYAFDHSKETYVSNSVTAGYYLQTGNPRYVSRIDLPDGSSARYTNGNLSNRIRISTGGDGYENVSMTNERSNAVTDADGFETTYTFGGMDIEVLTQFKDLLINSGVYTPDTKYKDPRILYYTDMEITHGDYGKETYVFDKVAGLSLASATDLSGNQREYGYGESITVPQSLADIWPFELFGQYSDPTYEKHIGSDGLVTIKHFAYESHFRIMKEYIDPKGRRTVTMIDSMGRRTDEKIYSDSNMLIQQTDFAYADTTWRGVVTAQTVKTLSGDPSWASDLVTFNELDTNGRIETSYRYPNADADGNSVPDRMTAYTYDNNNNRLSITEGSVGSIGKTTAFEYDARNRLEKTIFHDNSETSETRNYYDGRGNLIVQIDENDHATVNQYDALNRLEKTIRIINGSYPNAPPDDDYTPDSDDLVTSNSYNNVNSLEQTTRTDGPTTTMEYDGLQRVTKSTVSGSGFADQVTQFFYGNNSGGSVFNVSGFKPTLSISPRGYRTAVTYDSLYRPTQTKAEYEPGRYATTKTEYDLVGNPTQVTDPLGNATITEFDALNRPTLVTFADSTTVSTVYTATGLAYSVTDEKGKITTTEYDAAGRPIRVIQPRVPVYGAADDATPITKTFYDAYGNAKIEENPLGKRWITEYDARNRPTKVTRPATQYIDEAGNLQPAFASFTDTTYDSVGNVRSVTDARGNTRYTTYDEANRPVISISPQVTLANGNTVYPATRNGYDRSGNILTVEQGTVADPLVPTFSPARVSADNSYDGLGRLLTTTDAENITVSNQYDKGNNLIQVTDGESQVTLYTYDGLNRLRSTTYGGSGGDDTSLEYDAVNLVSRIDAKGQVTHYSYDNRHRLTDVFYVGAGHENRRYQYDLVGNITDVVEPGKGGLTDVHYTYDALSRIETETSAGITHKYSYDLAGNRMSTNYGDGSGGTRLALVSTYDALNRTLTIFEDDNGDGTHNGTESLSGYEYDLEGNIREKKQANGDIVSKTYDALGRILSVTGPGAAGSELYISTNAYDLYGNLTRLSETYPGGSINARIVINTYDDANRLTSETIEKHDGQSLADPLLNTVVTDYTYDQAHNRESRMIDADDNGDYTGAGDSIMRYVYDNALNQISYSYQDTNNSTAWDYGEARTDYSYGANGNRRTAEADTDGDTSVDKTSHYTYDRENRLVQLTENTNGAGEPKIIDIYPGAGDILAQYKTRVTYYTSAPTRTYKYAYDYRTRRVLRDESDAGGARTEIVFSGGTSVQEYAGGATVPTVEYIRGSDYGGGIGGILYSLRSSDSSFYHYNSRGDVVAKTDASGALGYQAAYEAFGKHGDTPTSEEWGTNPDPQQANTKDEDPTGLLNEGFRYRDLDTGTFITRDPLGFIDGPNVYTYVVQNPWTKFDPLGLYYNKDQFDDDGYMKKKEEIEKNEEYNKRVDHFNEQWKKARDTPTGSALHDHIINSDWRYSVDVMAKPGRDGDEKDHYSREDKDGKGSTSYFTSMDHFSYETIAHEFFHGVQDEFNPYLSLEMREGESFEEAERRWINETLRAMGTNVKGLAEAYSSEDAANQQKYFEKGSGGKEVRFPGQEAQATRVENMVEYEYLKKNDPERFELFIKHQWYRSSYKDFSVDNPLGKYSD
ncbi:RHS repeat-associated core domain-containing protein [Puniceicoccus vermicola]|uniref:RHS repeat-associated core domain-containing protein n=1 Tax=Puniceicoccus vermicola TaxID=388746 RepID=UPI0033924F15